MKDVAITFPRITCFIVCRCQFCKHGSGTQEKMKDVVKDVLADVQNPARQPRHPPQHLLKSGSGIQIEILEALKNRSGNNVSINVPGLVVVSDIAANPMFDFTSKDLFVWNVALSEAELNAVRKGRGLPTRALPAVEMMRVIDNY